MIDFKKLALDADRELEALLASRKAGISGVTDRNIAESSVGRGDMVTGGLQGIASEFNVSSDVVASGNVQGGQVGSRLGDQLENTVSQREGDVKRQHINLAYNKAYDAAVNAGQSLRASSRYATQFAQDEMRRINEAGMNEQRRESSRKANDQAIAQTKRMAEFDVYANVEQEYQQALGRIVASTASKTVALALLKKPVKPTPTTTSPTTSQTYGSGLDWTSNQGRIAGTNQDFPTYQEPLFPDGA